MPSDAHKHPRHRRPRHESPRQHEAARRAIVAARNVERRLPKTAAQRAADRRNALLIRRIKRAPTAKLIAAERKWAKKGEAAWRRGEKIYEAKGEAAWRRGEAIWRARGRAAWLRGEAVWRERRSGSVGSGAGSLRPGPRLPLGMRLSSTALRPTLTIPKLGSRPARFAQAITPTTTGERTAWRTARVHHFKRVIAPHRRRPPSIPHWRRSGHRTRPY